MAFESIKLDRSSSISLNTQLYRAIKNAVQSGQLKPGDQCPTEQELMDTLEISRSVVQHAYTLLMEQNILKRHRGKGTFVVEKTIDLDFLQKIQPMADLIKRSGSTANVKLISKKTIPFSFEQMGNLELDVKDQVLEVTRLYKADDEPLAVFHFYYPLCRFEGIEKFDFKAETLTEAIHQTFPNQFNTNYRSIFTVNLPEEICKIFKLPKHSVGFKIHNIAYNTEGLPTSTTVYYLKGSGTNIIIDFYKNITNK